jgi:hypothetical protein
MQTAIIPKSINAKMIPATSLIRAKNNLIKFQATISAIGMPTIIMAAQNKIDNISSNLSYVSVYDCILIYL